MSQLVRLVDVQQEVVQVVNPAAIAFLAGGETQIVGRSTTVPVREWWQISSISMRMEFDQPDFLLDAASLDVQTDGVVKTVSTPVSIQTTRVIGATNAQGTIAGTFPLLILPPMWRIQFSVQVTYSGVPAGNLTSTTIAVLVRKLRAGMTGIGAVAQPGGLVLDQ